MAFLRFSSLTVLFLLLGIAHSSATLNPQYYEKTCPQAESIIKQAVRSASASDSKVPARLLRMFFHDCFVRGCDASVLLDSTPKNRAEKDGPPNTSLAAFYVIDNAKTKLEKACPKTVSCADIIAIAARDVVVMSGGPHWDVLKGRKDGRISRANESLTLPAPSFNTSQLIQSFSQRGLTTKDMVTLSGGHTLGFSHCSSFEARLRNFSKVHDFDPSMNPNFAQELKSNCPTSNNNPNAGHLLDSTSSVFDNDYYKRIIGGKGVFLSDQTMMLDYRTRSIVGTYARDQSLFFREFAASMVKLGNVGVNVNGEVRLNCRVVN